MSLPATADVNAAIIIGAAAWVAVEHVGQLIAMSVVSHRHPGSDAYRSMLRQLVRKRRVIAAAVAYAAATAATVAFGVAFRRRLSSNGDLIGAMVLIFFGLARATYAVVPKVFFNTRKGDLGFSDVADDILKVRRAAGKVAPIVQGAALGVATIAGILRLAL